MPDKDWLKILATSQFTNGGWQPADPQAVQQLAAARVSETMIALYEEAEAACGIFNEFAAGRRQVRLLPLGGGGDFERRMRHGGLAAGATPQGLMLLLGRTQIKLQYCPHNPHNPHQDPKLEATMLQVAGFQRSSWPLHQFSPRIDALGTVLWQMDNSLLMTNELIIKRLLEDLLRAAQEAGI